MKPSMVLVVEDEPSISEMIQTLLEEEGYKVITASNGQEGLERLAGLLAAQNSAGTAEVDNSPVLSNLVVLTDLMMPILDGRRLLMEMRANPAYAEVPVIIMSAAGRVTPTPEMGQTIFIEKPFEIDVLLDTVAQFIPGKTE